MGETNHTDLEAGAAVSVMADVRSSDADIDLPLLDVTTVARDRPVRCQEKACGVAQAERRTLTADVAANAAAGPSTVSI